MWVREKLLPHCNGDYTKGKARSIIVMDNARIHRAARHIIESESKCRCILLPPYSPDLNPIELMFYIYKMGLKRYTGKMSHARAHRLALRDVTPTTARSYFKKSKVPKCDHYVSKDELEKQEQTGLLMACAVSSSRSLFNAATAFVAINNDT